MYYTGIDPRTGKRIFTAKSQREKATQRALMQYRLPANYEIVKAALLRAGRKDLIGHDPKSLIRPKAISRTKMPTHPLSRSASEIGQSTRLPKSKNNQSTKKSSHGNISSHLKKGKGKRDE